MKAIVGQRCRHYKNKKEYIILSVGTHTETMKEMVVYQAQYTDSKYGKNSIWIRPLCMFEEIFMDKGKMTERFVAI